ncbi:hypothetical protein [Brevibacillus sp. MER 51]|uniref:YaaC family protein n=1 Tax=Brevibacillus sp. MER 51 TaxID=2939560 RepID=UPI00203E9FCE|nr:hypothetical protein [Brevibacillus sp. MER 51]MCM3145085.1 hypothetical protein [Brevibacillus sp. MER 51]
MGTIMLKNLRSEFMAKKMLLKKAEFNSLNVCEELIEQKARGLSFCLRNAFDYFAQSGSLSSRALSTYYGYFSLLSAICMADLTNNATLSSLEKDTSLGHGAKSYEYANEDFPHSLKIYLTNGGFINAFKKYEGVNISKYVVDKGVKKVPEDVTKDVEEKSISFYTLLERVCELPDFTEMSVLFHQIFDVLPHGIPVHLHGNSISVISEETIRKMPYITEWRYNSHFEHYETKIDSRLTQVIPIYKNTLVSELFPGFFDPFVLHFLTLYSISIIVRYKPNLWREISEGNLEYFKLLINSYISNIHNVSMELSHKRIIDSLAPRLLRDIN